MRPRDLVEAEECYKRAVKTDSKEREALVLLASIYDRWGFTEKARETRKKAQSIEPKQVELAVVLNSTGYSREALTVSRAALHRSPNNLKAAREMGIAMIGLGANHTGVLMLKKVLSGSPNDLRALNSLLLAFFNDGKYSEGEAYTRRALETRGGSAADWLEVSRTLECGDPEGAQLAKKRSKVSPVR